MMAMWREPLMPHYRCGNPKCGSVFEADARYLKARNEVTRLSHGMEEERRSQTARVTIRCPVCNSLLRIEVRL